MTFVPHGHREYVPGCFRCEIAADEVTDEDILRDWLEGCPIPLAALNRILSDRSRLAAALEQERRTSAVLAETVQEQERLLALSEDKDVVR